MRTRTRNLSISFLILAFAASGIIFLAQASGLFAKGGQAVTARAQRPWNLTLVNTEHPLPEDFEPETRAIADYPERLFDVRAADALEAMFAAAKDAGQPLHLVSAYRSISYQKGLFIRKTSYYKGLGNTQEEAERLAAKWVARPCCSEHNLALAADVVSSTWYIDHSDLTPDFAATPAYAWLCENAGAFGFVVRYPEGKEEITGISFEPWHLRYVGVDAAKEMWEFGLCLEEYLTLLDERAAVPPVYEQPFN